MGLLPPADKLPLALRKNIRDNWDANKSAYEAELSALLGTPWTIDVNPLAIFPYGKDAYATEDLGTLISGYVKGALFQLSYHKKVNGADGIADLNSIASKHVLTMQADARSGDARATYCSCIIVDGGKLAIVFNPGELGTNDSDACEQANLLKALNEAPPAAGADADASLSFAAKASVRNEYDADIASVQAKIAGLVGIPDIQLVPNFETVFGQLKAESARAGSRLQKNWETMLGGFIYLYFDGVASQLEYNKFGFDEMLQEGFQEAVDKKTIAFRIVDKLAYAGYCEVVVEGGVLYIQTTLEKYGSNISDAGCKIVDQL